MKLPEQLAHYFEIKDEAQPKPVGIGKKALLAQLLKWFADKKSKRVVVARKELQRRLPFLSFKEQNKVVSVFLDSCAIDRDFVYKFLFGNWDHVYLETVENLWLQYHEARAASLIVKYAPLDFVKSHQEELSKEENYKWFSLRMAEDKDFVIDKERLEPNEYLYVLAMNKREISAEEALETLFEYLAKYMSRSFINFTVLVDIERNDDIEHEGGKRYKHVPSVLNLLEVKQMLWCIRELGILDDMEPFLVWEFGCSSETSKNSDQYKDYDVITSVGNNYLLSLIDNFPEKYRWMLKDVNRSNFFVDQQLLDSMVQENPAIGDIAGKLGLSVEGVKEKSIETLGETSSALDFIPLTDVIPF